MVRVSKKRKRAVAGAEGRLRALAEGAPKAAVAGEAVRLPAGVSVWTCEAHVPVGWSRKADGTWVPQPNEGPLTHEAVAALGARVIDGEDVVVVVRDQLLGKEVRRELRRRSGAATATARAGRGRPRRPRRLPSALTGRRFWLRRWWRRTARTRTRTRRTCRAS
jgi:hypothetical protein